MAPGVDAIAALHAEAKRNKAERAVAMDALVELLFERAALRRALSRCIMTTGEAHEAALEAAHRLLEGRGDADESSS